MIVDFALFPMYHIGSMPWKPGYVVLIATALWLVTTRRQQAFTGHLWKITALFVVLFVSTGIGSLVFFVQDDVSPSGETVRSLMIYALAPAALITGAWVSPRRYFLLIWLMAAFLGINLIVEIFREDVGVLTSFYGLRSQLDREFYETRSIGILENPNITALMMNVVLIYVLSSRRHADNESGRFDFVVAAWLAAATAILMISRNQFLAVGIITSIAVFRIGVRRIWQQYFVLGTLVFLIFLAGYAADDQINDALGFNPPTRLVERFGLALPGSDSEDADSVSRPLLDLDPATDRWSGSIIVGTGFEASSDTEAPLYHNDWLTVGASSGIIGLVAFSLIVVLLVRIEPLIIVLFIFPALTNSFVFAPQHFIGAMLFIGIIAQRAQARQLSAAPVI